MRPGSRQWALRAGAAAVLLAAVAWLVAGRSPGPSPGRAAAPVSVQDVLGGTAQGFARAAGPRPFRFPDDHGPHPEYRSEWWYFTGNLAAPSGGRFGFQLTLFRFALTADPPRRESQWAASQVYMAHLAVTDVAAGRFRAVERLSRDALGLAGARALPLRVWVGDWTLESLPDGRSFQVAAGEGEMGLSLTLEPLKDFVLQGDGGLSQKSAEPGNASYYYSGTRLLARGTVTVGGRPLAVEGLAWMDREWSTSALGPDQVGWDWFALQLDDQRELMLYRLRRRDGTVDPLSKGSVVEGDGVARVLRAEEVRVEVLAEWSSPRDGTRYPARWRIQVPREGLAVEVEPLLADQEIDLSVRYWEGAVRVTGTSRGRPVSGYGYVELTGYAR